MARKQRIELAGEVRHIIFRGYRKELFVREMTGEAFEETIVETVDRCGWKLHVDVFMSHHYHLALEHRGLI